MKVSKAIFSLILGGALLIAQVGSVLAAPALQDSGQVGEVVSLICGTDGTTVILTYYDENLETQEVEISLETAVTLGLIEDVNVECADGELVDSIVDIIDPAAVVPVEDGSMHPVGAVLATFFDFVDYEAIMEAHENGTGFGVIAQALWLTAKLSGDVPQEDFLAILNAKETGDFSEFKDAEGNPITNWGQFKKSVLDGAKKNNLGVVMSDKDNKTNNGKGPDKEDKTNNGKKPEKIKNKD